jgi:nucleotide-binding universal stress UspA family protein
MTFPKTIVVGTDFSSLGRLAVDAALALGKRLGDQAKSGVRVHLVHVVDRSFAPYPYAYSAVDLERVDLERVDMARKRLDEVPVVDGVNVTREVRVGIPSRDLAAAAKEVGADLLVIASHGYGAVRRAILGSVAASLIRTSDVPVLVIGENRKGLAFRTVVAGVDLSPVTRGVLDAALAYADPAGDIEVVSAFETPLVVADDILPRFVSKAELAKARETRINQITALIPEDRRPSVRVDALAKAPAALALLEAAEILGADLIVVGTSGHNVWHRMFIGSTATRVLAEAPCPVLVVPGKDER